MHTPHTHCMKAPWPSGAFIQWGDSAKCCSSDICKILTSSQDQQLAFQDAEAWNFYNFLNWQKNTVRLWLFHTLTLIRSNKSKTLWNFRAHYSWQAVFNVSLKFFFLFSLNHSNNLMQLPLKPQTIQIFFFCSSRKINKNQKTKMWLRSHLGCWWERWATGSLGALGYWGGAGDSWLSSGCWGRRLGEQSWGYEVLLYPGNLNRRR